MRAPRLALFMLALCSLAALACASTSPLRLEEQVALFHDDLRWARLPAAEQSVPPAQRERFRRAHAAWGGAVRIVDYEVQSARVADGIGTVHTRYEWLASDEVEVRQSVIETRWRPGMSGSWTFETERVVDGDPRILASR